MKSLRVELKAKLFPKPLTPPIPHHSGKGTRARLNTAAEKMFTSRSNQLTKEKINGN